MLKVYKQTEVTNNNRKSPTAYGTYFSLSKLYQKQWFETSKLSVSVETHNYLTSSLGFLTISYFRKDK